MTTHGEIAFGKSALHKVQFPTTRRLTSIKELSEEWESSKFDSISKRSTWRLLLL